ncbi:MAG TPA: SUMF1/EgtB/PvdO family nonheme iron enzyme [Chthonomonadaceae bacterium]|nr:SUMF1/EgtB/PvdO family nonheme iron enzyme [Chthonomonadaceae bacterium]
MQRVSGRCPSAMALGILTALLGMPGGSAKAQTAQVIEQFTREPHTGTAEQALVGIEVVTTAKDGKTTEVRHGDGFMLRCDGFVLAPSELFSMRMAGQKELAAHQTVTVLLHPGTEQEQRLPGRRPRILGTEIRIADKLYPLGYAVFKLDNIHQPALRTLLPDTLSAGAEVQVMGRGWDETAHKFAARPNQVVKLGEPPKNPGHLPPGFVPFAEPLKDVPAGSIVLGLEDMAVGIIPGVGQVAAAEGFVSFAVLQEATNCVLPVPTPDTLFTKAEEGKNAPNGAAADSMQEMVTIPGGPVLLPPALQEAQPDMEGAKVACVPTFRIDRYEVTNRDYLDFWLSLPERERQRESIRSAYYPLGWEAADPPYTDDVGRLPVLGVPLAGQQAFARWKGKRLLTPYEWLLAAYGPKGVTQPPDWIKRYTQDTDQTWLKVKQAHEDYGRAHPEIFRNGLVDFPRIPWIALKEEGIETALWSKKTVEAETAHLWEQWKDPPYLLPGGSRPFDKSLFGVMDMLLNGNEMVVGLPSVPYRNNLLTFRLFWPSDSRTLHPQNEMIPTSTAATFPLVNSSLPPPRLSRLYRRAYVSPFLDYIKAFSHLYETADMLRPLAECELRVGAGWTETLSWPHPFQISTFTSGNPRVGYSTRGEVGSPLDVYSREIAYPGYRLWTGMPPHYRSEIGRPVPLTGTAPMTDTESAELYYITPNGFRCAR